ncbi:unnamed protein product [Adineta ricciae]|uniref:Uncharacterized protein n=1 Tax=Adineta ricciae TaxID=249248 RepID=A0A815FS66_ADIRI|nr:unnamed protein product [Adineta ricciae]CAF1555986.1 unnamed protein product [Adineta ricciae]
MAIGVNKTEEMYTTVGATLEKMNSLINVWNVGNVNNEQFINKFKEEILSLEKKVINIAQPSPGNSSSAMSL